MKTVVEYLGKVSITVEEEEWSIDKAYDRLTIISSENSIYISKTAVPKGIELTNTKYWKFLIKSENVEEDIKQIRRELSVIEEDVRTLDGKVDELELSLRHDINEILLQIVNLLKDVTALKQNRAEHYIIHYGEYGLTGNIIYDSFKEPGLWYAFFSKVSKGLKPSVSFESETYLENLPSQIYHSSVSYDYYYTRNYYEVDENEFTFVFRFPTEYEYNAVYGESFFFNTIQCNMKFDSTKRNVIISNLSHYLFNA